MTKKTFTAFNPADEFFGSEESVEEVKTKAKVDQKTEDKEKTKVKAEPKVKPVEETVIIEQPAKKKLEKEKLEKEKLKKAVKVDRDITEENKLPMETIVKVEKILPKKERKSVRLNLLITPSLKDNYARISEQTGYSINDLIGRAMESFLENNKLV